MREVTHTYRGALYVIAGVLAVSTVLPLMVRPPKATTADNVAAVA
jgi:hypothetical protein